MKLKLNWNKKEIDLDAGVEEIIEKGLVLKSQRPAKKTRYQIKQEEKRKSEEMKHKHMIQMLCLASGILAAVIVFCIVMSLFEK